MAHNNEGEIKQEFTDAQPTTTDPNSALWNSYTMNPMMSRALMPYASAGHKEAAPH